MMSNQFSCMTPELCKTNPDTGICLRCGRKIAHPEPAKPDDNTEYKSSEKETSQTDPVRRIKHHSTPQSSPQKPLP